MQKYLSPTDRDEIAITLNLSNAQVITWFQVSPLVPNIKLSF